MTDQDFHLACEDILAAPASPALVYAIGYARAGLTMRGHEAKVQALYILNNISHWRGPASKEIRASLKRYAGVK